MKLFKILAALCLGLSFTGAQAAVAASGATLDWSSFSVSTYALGPGSAPSITWSTVGTQLSAMTVSPNSSQSASSFDWSSALSVVAGNVATSAGASASSALSVLAGDTDDNASSVAHSQASRSGSFAVTGSGLVVISVNYLTSALLQPGSLSPNYAYAYAALTATKGTTVSTVFDEIDLTDVNTNGNTVTHSGTFNLALFVQNGDLFSFSAMTKADAAVTAVPVPSAVWLFGTAVLSFLSVRRTKTA